MKCVDVGEHQGPNSLLMNKAPDNHLQSSVEYQRIVMLSLQFKPRLFGFHSKVSAIKH